MTQLRRVLQSERHVVCVHPLDLTPDSAYEASLIQKDVHVVLLPLLPGVLRPGVRRLVDLLPSLGGIKLVELELSSRQQVLIGQEDGKRAALPGWELLRRLGDEVAEVTAFTERAELSLESPLFVSGSFTAGGQFQTSLRPNQPETRGRLVVTAESGRAELTWTESAERLKWPSGEQDWDAGVEWPALVTLFEESAARKPAERSTETGLITWQDEIRSLELDDAVRRSVERRRSVSLEYPEVSEEVGFKGTMTLVGCGLLWLIVVLLIGSLWVPGLRWVVPPVLVGFLLLQTLLWVARRSGQTSTPSTAASDSNSTTSSPAD
jgi:hypothetical protein